MTEEDEQLLLNRTSPEELLRMDEGGQNIALFFQVAFYTVLLLLLIPTIAFLSALCWKSSQKTEEQKHGKNLLMSD